MTTPLLQVSDLTAGYGPIEVLHGLDFEVGAGEVVAILGANGAGKTTLMRALSGLLSVKGEITFAGRGVAGSTPEAIVAKGIALVPEGRGTFSELTVEENLRAGAFLRRGRGVEADMEDWYGIFPRLGEHRARHAGELSGGEQQMLAVARCLMSRPSLMLLDEPSLGLAPLLAGALFERLGEINEKSSMTMLVVEQNAGLALELADRAYVMEVGRFALEGSADELRRDDSIRRVYLGY
jgi:branched-chain amino acid transport system ATP-binding protein